MTRGVAAACPACVLAGVARGVTTARPAGEVTGEVRSARRGGEGGDAGGPLRLVFGEPPAAAQRALEQRYALFEPRAQLRFLDTAGGGGRLSAVWHNAKHARQLIGSEGGLTAARRDSSSVARFSAASRFCKHKKRREGQRVATLRHLVGADSCLQHSGTEQDRAGMAAHRSEIGIIAVQLDTLTLQQATFSVRKQNSPYL